MARGKIIQFDPGKGYGFIAPEGSGEDVFVHVSDFDGHDEPLRTGMQVEFKVIDGPRGPKAYDVCLVTQPQQATPPAPAVAAPATAGDDSCEVILTAVYLREITDTLMTAAPSVTAAQIVEVRNRLAAIATQRGWLT